MEGEDHVRFRGRSRPQLFVEIRRSDAGPDAIAEADVMEAQ